MQFDYSMKCYRLYASLQAVRDSIDLLLKDPSRKWKAGVREQMQSLRGNGAPEYGDILYGSIRETSVERETIVGLQEKLLYMLSLLQSADARPTAQAVEAVQQLEKRHWELSDQRWRKLR
jgi:hypothetical protein